MVSYKKDRRGHLIFEGGKIQEVVLSDLVEAINLEFSGILNNEIVFSGGGSGDDAGKLRVGPMSFGFQNLKDSIQTTVPLVPTLAQVISQAVKFPSFRIDKTIVFWGTQGELCITMEKN